MAWFESFKDVNTGEKHSVYSHDSIRYQFDDGSLCPVLSSPAWCYDCLAVVYAEHIESEVEKENARKSTIEVEFDCSEREDMFDLLEHKMTVQQIEEREKHWARFNKRTRPPTCLSCHGTKLHELNAAENGSIEIPNGPNLCRAGMGFADVGPQPDLITALG